VLGFNSQVAENRSIVRRANSISHHKFLETGKGAPTEPSGKRMHRLPVALRLIHQARSFALQDKSSGDGVELSLAKALKISYACLAGLTPISEFMIQFDGHAHPEFGY
jgi:hypothetical protein